MGPSLSNLFFRFHKPSLSAANSIPKCFPASFFLPRLLYPVRLLIISPLFSTPPIYMFTIYLFPAPPLLVATPPLPELPVYPRRLLVGTPPLPELPVYSRPLLVATPTLPELPVYSRPLLVGTPPLPELPVYIGSL